MLAILLLADVANSLALLCRSTARSLALPMSLVFTWFEHFVFIMGMGSKIFFYLETRADILELGVKLVKLGICAARLGNILML